MVVGETGHGVYLFPNRRQGRHLDHLVHLSKRRLILFHFFSRGMVLQAPLGAKGAAGKEGGRFEVEQKGGGKILTFRTSLRGGGRVRIYVKDAEAWLKDIVENE